MHSRYSPLVLVGLVCLACSEEPKPIDYSHAADFTYSGVLQANAPLTFRSVSADAQGYEWDFGDGTAPATGQQVAHTFVRSSLFTVKLTASTAGGAIVNTRKLTIAVQPVDYSHAADFTYTGVLRSGEPITFNGTSPLAQGYQWDFGDGTAPSTGQQAVHTFRRGGTFPVTLTATTAGGPILKDQQLTIIQSDTLSRYFAAVVGAYRFTREYVTYNYGVVTPCDIPFTAVRSGNRLVLQYDGGGTSGELGLAPLSYKPGYYSFGTSDYYSQTTVNFKIGTDSIFFNSYRGGQGGSTETWRWGKRR